MTYQVALLRLTEAAPWLWRLVRRTPVLRTWVNRLFINSAAMAAPPRPRPYSLWGPTSSQADVADYVSWAGLVDRTWSGRHLPPADAHRAVDLPSIDRVCGLFESGPQLVCPRSTVLFSFFAQWFTDSFLRTDPEDVRKNTSNHEIDLCQIYGLEAADTALLRGPVDGKLKSQWIDGQEYPADLCDEYGSIRNEFRTLSFLQPLDGQRGVERIVLDPFRKEIPEKRLFATGLERGNQSIFYVAISTIFLREHNRLCDLIRRDHGDWTSDRIFEAARATSIVQLLKIVIEDYVNHLSGKPFRVFVEVGFAEKQPWYRTNRIAAEFDLLYRWHSLVPRRVAVDGAPIAQDRFRFDNRRLIERGVEEVIASAANVRAGRVGLFNSPAFLLQADRKAIEKSRAWRLRSYNDYRDHFKLGRFASFEEMTRSAPLAAALRSVYAHVDDVELLVGLLAEWRGDEAVFGDLMQMMVGTDAFTQALTNPLLARVVQEVGACSNAGMRSIAATASFGDLVERNSRLAADNARFGSPRLMMRPSSIAAPRIPGGPNIPLLSTAWQTLRFLVGGDRYLLACRRRHASEIFRVNLFRPTIAITDPAAVAVLFDAATIRQDYGFSWAVPPRPLVGDITPSIFASGPAHDRHKQLYIDLVHRRLPVLISTMDSVAGRHEAEWLARGAFDFTPALEAFAADFAFGWLLRLEVDTQAVGQLYLQLFAHPLWRVARYFPQSGYRRSLRTFQALLAQVAAAPGFADVLSLAAAHGLDDREELARQMLFVTGMNSFLGLQNLSKSVVAELGSRSVLRAQLRAEMRPTLGDAPVTHLSQLSAERMPLLDRVLREILRLHPPVSYIFGRSTGDIDVTAGGRTYGVKAGELMMGVLSDAQRNDGVFTSPDAFNPYRMFGPHDSTALIWPRGLHDRPATATDRTCPAKDVVVVIMKLLAVRLLTRFEWTFESPPKWRARSFDLNRSAPHGRLPVTGFRRLP